ncbi:MAG: type II toxin-antitoxin system PemK/MazF family toxin [Spirochaeta sp.]|jgi:mRNA interferase MazF|nr:type II toxin-antitoxin system PemK/MazF family toxin [Spirochaeta sp.]
MKRGDIYLVKKPFSDDPKKRRAFVVVSRQILIDSNYATVMCAPVFSAIVGLDTQVTVGVGEGLKHDSAIHCDNLVSLPKSALTNFVGSLGLAKEAELNRALAVALSIEV